MNETISRRDERAIEDERRDLMLLQGIKDYMKEHGYQPSIRNIADICGLASTSSASWRLAKLEQRGWIVRDSFTARGIRIVKDS